MTQQLRVLEASAEGPQLIPSTQWQFTAVSNSSPGHLLPSSDLLGHCMHTVHSHTFMQNAHTHKIK